ncbi:MAG: hypothetical protein PHQ96_05170 [Candidatus Omnitrophica bacterium]|nr:hypothetical protein [Candidatus Omnitrophota bacterium]
MGSTALKTAGVIFIIAASVHLARFVLRLKLAIGPLNVPPFFSVVAAVSLLLLAMWMFKSARYY